MISIAKPQYRTKWMDLSAIDEGNLSKTLTTPSEGERIQERVMNQTTSENTEKNELKPLTGMRIGILGKGGSGKSTLAVFLARMLHRQGYDVILLDADSTNVGMHLALGMDHSPASLIEYYGGMVFSGGSVTCPVDDPTPLPGAELTLDELPAQYYRNGDDGICLLTAGKIGDLGPGAGCDGPISKIARDIKIQSRGMNQVTLVDFKAGFEDSARGAITSLDWAVVVVDPTNASIQMAIHMRDMVDQIHAGKPPATEHLEDPELVAFARMLFKETKIRGVLTILNRVKDDTMEDYLCERLNQEELDPVGVIHEDPSITTSWLRGTPLKSAPMESEIEATIKNIESNILKTYDK
jgi:CO dehydrogenase maturation factor